MRTIVWIALGLGGFVGSVRYLEARSVFFPSSSLNRLPSEAGLDYEDVWIASGGHRLHGWWIPVAHPRGCLVFFHGNAGNIGDRVEKVALFARMGLNVLIVDYRGYGHSEGRPSEKGLYEDAAAVYRYARENKGVSIEKMVVYGASLGGAVAVDLAARVPVGALIVDSSFTNAQAMARRMFPWIPVAGWMLKTRFDSLDKIQRIDAPKLIVHSRQDELVPFAMGQALFEAAKAPKEFLEIKGGHNDSFVHDQQTFVRGVRAFLQRHLSDP